MSIVQYDLRKIPTLPGGEDKGYYPTVSHPGKLAAQELYETIEKNCTLNAADVKAVLDALAAVMASALGQGRRVEVPELGYFSLSLKSDRRITDPHDKQIADHLRVNEVRFKPMKKLGKRLGSVSFRRTTQPRRAASLLSAAETAELLRDYFSDPRHDTLTSAEFQSLTGYSRTTANNQLALLVAGGTLVKLGRSNAPYYRLA